MLDPERAIAVRTAMRKVEASIARYSRNDSQDIVQEALLRAVRHGVDCDAEPWLRTVAKRIAIDRARAAREVVAISETAVEASMRSTHGDPEELLLANETLDLIRKALAAMPARYRDALLAYVEEQETEAVARRFGISTNATWTLLSRARARLRVELRRVGYAAGVFAFRFQHWSDDATTAIASAGVAISVAVSSPAVPVEVAPQMIEAPPMSSAAPTPSLPLGFVDPAAKPTPSEVPAPHAANAPAPADTSEGDTVAHYEVHSCSPLPEMGAEVEVIDEDESPLDPLLEPVPEDLRVMDQPDC